MPRPFDFHCEDCGAELTDKEMMEFIHQAAKDKNFKTPMLCDKRPFCMEKSALEKLSR